MNLGKRDIGRRFIAPSGREVELVGVMSTRFMFVYVDDREDGLVLSLEGLKILERVQSAAKESKNSEPA
ncbi:hypothetical protein [Paraburkholderia tropica]|uniref:hypothetical protein n=1 Tax=Paraburkholderia tropica TaxID=92647 RepID=UPI001F244E02|nr:hypothetical protein [Paraburkholderia tropica]